MLFQERDYPFSEYPELFEAIQKSGIFPDSKTFVDSMPISDPGKLNAQYLQQKASPDFSLEAFVEDHFESPEDYQEVVLEAVEQADDHIRRLWHTLTIRPGMNYQYSSLIALPYPMVVPGGRFREMYYWDSYFTMLGLRESEEFQLLKNMVDNFAFLLRNYGFIPNGVRSYFLSRSQPPFFSLMVRLLAETMGPIAYLNYLDALEKEYQFWMKGKRLVELEEGKTANRYWDDCPEARPESYREDIELAEKSDRPAEKLYRDLRAACESGWDFSSRWLSDPKDLSTIRTTRLLPVDLNCLLLHLEESLAKAYGIKGSLEKVRDFTSRVEARKEWINSACWHEESGWYSDFDLDTGSSSPQMTLAGAFPLFFQLADSGKAERCASVLEEKFLGKGGFLTSTIRSGQQWDAPNGWAPLQWMAFKGLQNYGHSDLAMEGAGRWIQLNDEVFRETGKMMEKYNVADENIPAGGGEYPNQDGFGWTNGIYQALRSS
jgi:alpha,alpha-trehalase